ncbi:MAG TPA: Spy/CpxP family protein refolding chaperone [Caldimonas sp.]|nr:Spy/CpxP family protein refolding chaperone [Caldimonas sp.]HEV7576996.1 Spy/CpxP family protein refolding chaperone [Caldimonas sp.]
MHRSALACAALLVCAMSPAVAQHADGYASFQTRDIKALSPEQVEDLREGRGMGLSLPAELNGTPGPLHVLQLRETLNITPMQSIAIEAIRSEMSAAARRLGASIIDAEAELDAAFKGGTADESGIRFLTQRIAGLNGELRATHLSAHLKTRGVLSEIQVAAYNAARGYADKDSAADIPQGHKH